MLDKARIQRIYGMGATLGMLDRENHSDDIVMICCTILSSV